MSEHTQTYTPNDNVIIKNNAVDKIPLVAKGTIKSDFINSHPLTVDVNPMHVDRIMLGPELTATINNKINESVKREIENMNIDIDQNNKNNKNNEDQISFNLTVCDNIKTLYSKQKENLNQIDDVMNTQYKLFSEILELSKKISNQSADLNSAMIVIDSLSNELKSKTKNIDHLETMIKNQQTEIEKKNVEFELVNTKLEKLEKALQLLLQNNTIATAPITTPIATPNTINNITANCVPITASTTSIASATSTTNVQTQNTPNTLNTQFGCCQKNKSEKVITISPKSNISDSKFLDRMQRANTQKISVELMYITNDTVTCQVIGTTGNLYVVNLNGIPSCTCLDYEKNYNKCKHILYVLHKLLKLDNLNRSSIPKNEILTAIKNEKINKKIAVIESTTPSMQQYKSFYNANKPIN